MANLRANTVCGSGGRNAIDGSVVFNGQNSYLKVDDHSDLALGTGDFTIETWVYFTSTGTYQSIIDFRGAGNGAFPFIVRDTDGDLYYFVNSGKLIDNVPARADNSWHHIAVVRSSGTTKFYLNGVEAGSASDSTTYLASNDPFIGASDSAANDLFGILSNLRITKSALYTSTFTPPEKLTVVDNTVLLCCQDSDDPTQEETGKTITGYGSLAAGQPIQPKVLPPVGMDDGVVFGGEIKFNTPNVMYFPTGDTSQGGRGRAVMGPIGPSAPVSYVRYVQIQSGGFAEEFGSLTVARYNTSAVASSTRGVFAGGFVGPMNNTMDYITIAATGNALDFGDLTGARHQLGALSNDTRGLLCGGYVSPTDQNTIDYVTIATTGDAINFGDLIGAIVTTGPAGVASPTRGCIGGGSTPSASNVIAYVTIATTGNAADFGDLTQARSNVAGLSSPTRGVFCGGTSVNTVDYITIATTGNAAEFGDLYTGAYLLGATSNSIRGIQTGGNPGPGRSDIQTIIIASTGNSTRWGDLTQTTGPNSATSDSHGGLSE